MATVRVNGVRLHCEERGDGEAILGIHGTPGTALFWRDAAAALSRLGRCIVYDRRGFHASERPEPFDAVDLADHVLDAAEVLESLHAVPAVVIGRSTGGLIALGEGFWEELPEGLRTVLAEQVPAVLAEIRGRGLDLSLEPLRLGPEDLGTVRRPALVVAAADSPDALHRVAQRLVELLPLDESATVGGGHLIDPAHPVVLEFTERALAEG